MHSDGSGQKYSYRSWDIEMLLPTTILPQFALDPAFDALSHTSDRFDCQIAQFQQFTRLCEDSNRRLNLGLATGSKLISMPSDPTPGHVHIVTHNTIVEDSEHTRMLAGSNMNKEERTLSLRGLFNKRENKYSKVVFLLARDHLLLDINNDIDFSHPDDTDIGQASEHDHLPPSRTASPASQFEVDDIQVWYHPNSGCPTQAYHFEDYRCGPGAPAAPPKVDPEPWHTFRTRIDFEVAELAHEAALTHEQMDRFIKLIHRSRCKLFTLRNRKDVRDTWDAASFKLTPVDLLQDPEVGPHFVFDAQQLLKFNGEKFVWYIHEPWTANAFWEHQSKIPSDGKPLAFVLYADKAKLSSFGRAKGYPIVVWYANLPAAVCNGEGLGGGQVVKEDKKHSKKPAFVNFKNAVWHTSFLTLLACLAPLSKLGSPVRCWDDVVHTFYPIILILSADYEEQVVMVLICGLMGKFPCPVCLIPHSMAAEVREQVLSSKSLRDVNNAFDTMEHTDVYQALSFDKLHFNDEGKFDHLWTELQKWITNSGRQAAVLIDALQVVSISFADGTKYEDISKLIVFAAHNSYVEFNTYASLEVHTEDTIRDGRNTLLELTELMDIYIKDTADFLEKSWNFPKMHLSAHLFDDIEAKGVTQNYNTKPNEKMHGPLKDAYQDRTNFKNFAEQLRNTFVARWIYTLVKLAG
ncbi:hypothetical protein EDD22DRAFT_849145 [Suillus occidentalis]|nr:hypothetical protein EDD22DRAFT_849145 [Suillus occidentalis]